MLMESRSKFSRALRFPARCEFIVSNFRFQFQLFFLFQRKNIFSCSSLNKMKAFLAEKKNK